MPLIDLTEQRDHGSIGPYRGPRWRRTDYLSEVREAIGNKPEYYDEYRFSGRTFRKRNILTQENHDL